MLIIDILENAYLLTNLHVLLMFQFFVGVGIGIFLGTEYNFRPYVNVFKRALTNIEKYYSNQSSIINSSYFLPYLTGERTPHNNPFIRGSFHSIKTNTDKTDMQYAVIEGISFAILDGVKSILKVNENFDKIYVVGGGSKSSFWIQFLSSLLNRKLRICDQSEFGAALGVARLAIYADKI